MKTYVNEPFLINPPKRYKNLLRSNPLTDLMIVNKPTSMKRGGVQTMRKHSRRIRFSGRRSLGLMNPFSGMDFSENRRKRRYNRNPAILGTIAPALDTSTILPELAGGLVGFVAAKAIPTLVMPANWQSGVMKYVGQGVSTLVVSYAASKVMNKRVGKMVLYGGMIAIGTELLGGLLLKVGVPISDVMGMGLYLSPQDMSYYMSEKDR